MIVVHAQQHNKQHEHPEEQNNVKCTTNRRHRSDATGKNENKMEKHRRKGFFFYILDANHPIGEFSQHTEKLLVILP
jgi:hypothetical protein